MFERVVPSALLLLAACGGDAQPVDDAGRVRVVAERTLPADRQALRAASGGKVVVALDAAASLAAIEATSPAATAEHVLRVTIDAPPEVTEKMDREVRVVDETGAAVAVDLALLHIAGIALPTRIPLGTRCYTGLEPAPTTRVGPGDVVVAMLRSQHAAELDPRPAIDVAYPVGFVRGDGKPWHLRCEREVLAAAGRYTQLHLQVRDAAGDAAALARGVGELLDLGCRAIVVSLDDPAALAAVRARADEQRVALIALDPQLRPGATCCVGADQDVLGRAAAEQLRAAVAGPAEVVLVSTAGDALAPARATGFKAALGSKRP